jgi:hypothetical protein
MCIMPAYQYRQHHYEIRISLTCLQRGSGRERAQTQSLQRYFVPNIAIEQTHQITASRKYRELQKHLGNFPKLNHSDTSNPARRVDIHYFDPSKPRKQNQWQKPHQQSSPQHIMLDLIFFFHQCEPSDESCHQNNCLLLPGHNAFAQVLSYRIQ